ncbi:MAG: hypothetical protein MGG11_22930 [Trichodesmium sp. MAG_R03]|nr:hypothetical protein [Trichodesmium sp. MAG_R03]
MISFDIATNVCSQTNYSNVNELVYEKYNNSDQLEYSEISGKFEQISIFGMSDDTLYWVFQTGSELLGFENISIERSFSGNKLVSTNILFDDQKFRFYSESNEGVPYDVDPDDLTVHQINYKEKQYLLFLGRGIGILRSGSFSDIYIMNLFLCDEGIIKSKFSSWSRFGSPYLITDIGNDGNIDFLKISHEGIEVDKYNIYVFVNIFDPIYPQQKLLDSFVIRDDKVILDQ